MVGMYIGTKNTQVPPSTQQIFLYKGFDRTGKKSLSSSGCVWTAALDMGQVFHPQPNLR